MAMDHTNFCADSIKLNDPNRIIVRSEDENIKSLLNSLLETIENGNLLTTFKVRNTQGRQVEVDLSMKIRCKNTNGDDCAFIARQRVKLDVN